MKTLLIRKYYCEKQDYKNITKQLKEKGVKIKDVAKELGMSRTTLYETLSGKYDCGKVWQYLYNKYQIKVNYSGEVIQ